MNVQMTRREALVAGMGLTATAFCGGITYAMPSEPAGKFGKVTGYYKHIGFLKRAPNLTHAQFVDHWIKVHGPLFAETPGVAHYALNVMDEPSARNPYDGAAELWWESEDAFRAAAAMKGPIAQKNVEDAKYLLDRKGSVELSVISREIEIVEPTHGANRPQVKQFFFIKRSPGMSDDEFAAAWRDRHAKQNAADPQISALVAGWTLNIIDHSDKFTRKTHWDGYATTWYRDRAALQKARDVMEKRTRSGPLLSTAANAERFVPFADSWEISMTQEFMVR